MPTNGSEMKKRLMNTIILIEEQAKENARVEELEIEIK